MRSFFAGSGAQTIFGNSPIDLTTILNAEIEHLKKELDLLQYFNDGNDFAAAARSYSCPELDKRLFGDGFIYKLKFNDRLQDQSKKGVTTYNHCLYCLHATIFLSTSSNGGHVAFDLEIPGLAHIFIRPVCNFFLDAYNQINDYQAGDPCLMVSLTSQALAQIKINIALRIKRLEIRNSSIHN